MSDVAAGAFLGTLLGTMYAIRGIFRLDRVVMTPAAADLLAGGCTASDGGSAGPERGASLLHNGAGSRMYHEQCSV